MNNRLHAVAVLAFSTLWSWPNLALAQSQPIPPPPGLVAWWPGDGDANDIQGTNNGSLQAGATFTTGMVGQAFSFNGTGAQVLATASGLPIGTADRSIEFWTRIDRFVTGSDPYEAFFCGYGQFGLNGGTYHAGTLDHQAGTLGDQLFWSQWGNGISAVLMTTGQWYHVAVASASGLTTLYVNGAAVVSGSVPFNTPDGTSFLMGYLDPGRTLQGALDEVSVYNRALSANEILSIYQAGSAGKIKPLSVRPDTFAIVSEACANGAIDPGERVTVSVGLRNSGTVNTTNLVATLLAGGGVSSPSGPQTYGVLVTNGAPVARSFRFTGSGNCGEVKTATLQLQEGTNLGLATFTFILGQNITTTNSEQFDSVTPPGLPTGWTTSAWGAESPWATTTVASDSGPNSIFVPDVTYIGWSELDSPVFTLPTGAVQLSFRHYYDLEWSYDGGVLEINVNGGGWNDILTAGGSFVGGGYVMPISTFYGSPLAGRSAWTGDSRGFLTTLVNLPPAAAGQSVQFRWVCGTDNSLTYTGWYVDTMAITTRTAVCCAPPPVFTDVTRAGSALTLNWSALPGRTYQLFYSTSLAPANWTPLTTTTASDFTATANDSITLGRQRFYRVMLLP